MAASLWVELHFNESPKILKIIIAYVPFNTKHVSTINEGNQLY